MSSIRDKDTKFPLRFNDYARMSTSKQIVLALIFGAIQGCGARHRIALVTQPPGAHVINTDGNIIGATPMETTVGRLLPGNYMYDGRFNTMGQVTFRREGCNDETVSLWEQGAPPIIYAALQCGGGQRTIETRSGPSVLESQAAAGGSYRCSNYAVDHRYVSAEVCGLNFNRNCGAANFWGGWNYASCSGIRFNGSCQEHMTCSGSSPETVSCMVVNRLFCN